MTLSAFTGSFTQQASIPEEAIMAAVEVMRSVRMHRYILVPDEVGEVMAPQREFADWQGTCYCLATASRGQAMQIALRAAGVQHGDAVLPNGFTPAPVPGAVSAVNARTILAEITAQLSRDIKGLTSRLSRNGVELKWFGAADPEGYTSVHSSWHCIAEHKQPATDEILAGLFDMRLPLTFGLGDCNLIADHILNEVAGSGARA